jgi:hypothetical protein
MPGISLSKPSFRTNPKGKSDLKGLLARLSAFSKSGIQPSSDDSASLSGIKPPSVESRDMEKSGGGPGPLHLTGKFGAAARAHVLTK